MADVKISALPDGSASATDEIPVNQAGTTRKIQVSEVIGVHTADSDPHTQYQKESEKGAVNGYASLDSGGTVPDAQIPAAIARDSEVTTAVSNHAAAADPHTIYQKESEKGVANGYASLDGNTRVPTAQIASGTADADVYARGDGSWQPSTFGRIRMKTADESRNLTITVANDTDIQFDLAANTKYRFQGNIFFDTVAAADFKWRIAGPTGATLIRIHRYNIAPGTTTHSDIAVDTAYSVADIAVTSGGADGGYVHFQGIIFNGGTAGTFAFQWAQNTSNASNTTVRAGSFLAIVEIL